VVYLKPDSRSSKCCFLTRAEFHSCTILLIEWVGVFDTNNPRVQIDVSFITSITYALRNSADLFIIVYTV